MCILLKDLSFTLLFCFSYSRETFFIVFEEHFFVQLSANLSNNSICGLPGKLRSDYFLLFFF